jgi:hypothetical protein
MKRNTEAIVRLATEKSHKARQRVLVALQELRQQGGPITFTVVCQAAQVSKTFQPVEKVFSKAHQQERITSLLFMM